MERPNAWKDYTAEQLDELHYLCEGYKAYISDNKTERECCAAAVSLAEEAGYVDLAAKIAAGREKFLAFYRAGCILKPYRVCTTSRGFIPASQAVPHRFMF